MKENTPLLDNLYSHFTGLIQQASLQHDEVTVVIEATALKKISNQLRDHPVFTFEQLIDVTAVDYLHYGQAEWETQSGTAQGFDRGVRQNTPGHRFPQRFAVVYHLLSLTHNQRLRLKVFLPEDHLEITSVSDIWASANWFEREVYDLFGIYFTNHPDLRRILTDYGFVGHPFRKDFPLSGHVEVRYDATQGRVIYEPIQLEPRVLVPKVIRKDERYAGN